MTFQKNILFSILFIFLFQFSFAQRASKAKTKTLTADEAKAVKKDAGGMFSSEDYKNALVAYLELIKTKPQDLEYNYRTGVSYVLSNSIKSKAIPFLEFASQGKDAKKDASFYLGIAYMNDNRWDDAVKAFNNYKAAGSPKLVAKDAMPVERLLEMCKNGKELTQHSIDIKFDNMGKYINSPFEDYSPYVSADERTMVYSSRRKGNLGGMIAEEGVYTADVYWTSMRDSGGWNKGKSVGATLNTDWDEETTAISPDGQCMFLYFDNMDVFGDLGVAMLKGKNWQKPMMMSDKINTKAIESGGCMSNDGNTFFFASEKKETTGGSDLWVTKRQGEGEWGVAQNLGSVVNTRYDEIAPFIALDGKTLFFSSKGHNSMGGFDIFKTVYDSASAKWSKPVNVGYPLNTADDEYSFCLSGNGRTGYVAAVRPEGLGDKDIYKVTFNEQSVYPFESLVSGYVTSGSGTKPELRQVSLINKSDKKVVALYKPYFISNHYVLTARPGNYTLKVEGYGFQPIEEEITIAESESPSDVVKDFTVTVAK